MGHEYSGTVLDVGKGVSRSLVGRAVACEPNYGCGKCADCRLSRISQCPKTVRVGGFAERVVLPEAERASPPEGARSRHRGTRRAGRLPPRGARDGPDAPGATVVVIGAASWASSRSPSRRRKGAGLAILSDPVASRRTAARGSAPT